MSRKYYTTSQAANLLAVSPDAVLKWVRQGKIASYRTPGGHARIPHEAIENLLPSKSSASVTNLGDAPPVYHYCWEFHGRPGATDPECLTCVVYRSRARRCYEMRDLPEEFGHLKLHCKTDCIDCEYFHAVQGKATSVLVVTRNNRLREQVESEARGHDMVLRFVDSEYDCAAVINEFRPDYVVIDCSCGASRAREMCRHLSRDERIPFTKIILSSHSENIKDCYDGRIFGWIKKPFTFTQLRCCIGQAE